MPASRKVTHRRKNPGFGDYLSAAKKAVVKHGSRIASEIAEETHAIATKAKEEVAKAEKSRALTTPAAALEVLAKSLGYSLVKANPRKRRKATKRRNPYSETAAERAARHADNEAYRAEQDRVEREKDAMRAQIDLWIKKGPKRKPDKHGPTGTFKLNPKKSRAKKSPLAKLRRRESMRLTSSLFRLGGTKSVSGLRALKKNRK